MSHARDLLLTGLPRSGTTLCCHVLNTCPDTLALNEPLDPAGFPVGMAVLGVVAHVRAFFADSRRAVVTRGRVRARLKNGSVPENPVAALPDANGLRQAQVTLGWLDVSSRRLAPEFRLVVKHNALFAAVLPELLAEFPVWAVVRNPLAVLASWGEVDLPVRQGRIPAAERFDPGLRRALDAIDDRLGRQLHLLEWFCRRYLANPVRGIVRYEDFVVRPSLLCERMGIPIGPEPPPNRTSRNTAYARAQIEILATALLGYGEAIWQVYSRDEVRQLLDDVRRGAYTDHT